MSSPNRLEKNLEVLDKLYHYLKKNPTIRFGQALSNLNLATHRLLPKEDKPYNNEDIFYEEPEETLTKMRNV